MIFEPDMFAGNDLPEQQKRRRFGPFEDMTEVIKRRFRRRRRRKVRNDVPIHEPGGRDVRPVIKATRSVYRDILSDMGQEEFDTEQGGILLGMEDEPDLLLKYVKDEAGEATPVSFTLDHQHLNRVLKEVKAVGMTLVGIVHLHPPGINRPSGGDLSYLRKLFRLPGNDVPYILFPIVSQGRLYPWIVARNDRVFMADLIIV